MILTNLEAIAVTISNLHKLTICNIYLPRSHNFNLVKLQQLTDQLPKPYIIVEDFNSHNEPWGSPNIASLSSTQNHQIVNLKIEFKRLRAKARLTFKTSKTEAWKRFVTSLNRNARNHKIWNSIKSINGNKYSQFTQFLTNDQGEAEPTADGMANILAHTFSANSSNENFSPDLLRHKKSVEDNFTRTDNCDDKTGINASPTMQELTIAVPWS